MECNIIIAGVGGQGVVLLAELLGRAAVEDNLRVCGSEVLGMAVRGGSVSSTVRISDREIFSPLVASGGCDLFVAMEASEALRYTSFMSPSTTLIVNTETVMPFMVTLGKSGYPEMERIIEKLGRASGRVITLDANTLAQRAGSRLAANIVMLGALFGTGRLPIKVETINRTIQTHFSSGQVHANVVAFELGYQEASADKL